ncbi:MAG: hypothetical protein HYS77_04055 [Candidatus Rokubacteria bacterium]|nr:hypothetical protein [Candidatus Rokubacteria bacterium]MBI2158476.1 hypothetical protein [Candidatus Rokubacteria bacterium]MBI4629541.1 hypothetical protein [Candidatus Rokubacteria bacterium]
MTDPRDEVTRAVEALLARTRGAADGGTPSPEALAEANLLLARARAARAESPLVAAMRDLDPASTRAELVTRLAALRRALDFV